jgi:MFS family permease
LVFGLTLVSMLAMIDKNLIQLMVGSIKRDVGLTDSQISLLIGAAFAVANIATSLPAGWLADRVGRKALIGGGALLWSLATVAGGLSGTFATLFWARAAVGCGEGLIPPASYSLIGDGVAAPRRGRALAVYSMATTAGAGISLIICGALIGAIVAYGVKTVPVIGPIRPWQLALVIIGFAGLPVLLVLPTLPAVERRVAPVSQATRSFADAWRFAWRRKALFGPLLVYSVTQSMIMATNGAWVPALTERKFSMSPQQFGPIMGVLLLLCGPLGLWLAGAAIDRLQQRVKPGAPIVAIASAAALMLATVGIGQAPTFGAFLAIEALAMMSTTTFLVVTSTIVAQDAPANMVGKIMSIFLFAQGLAGPALAPTIAAFMSDYNFAQGSNALGNSISTIGACCGVVGLAMAILLYRTGARGRSAPSDAECLAPLPASVGTQPSS